MNSNLRSTALALALATLAPGAAHAVRVSQTGFGDVLLYPYYTVEGGAQTVITIVNTSEDGKALRVAFREAVNGRAALSFNLYLGANDVWTGAVFATDAEGPANLISRDESCTVFSPADNATPSRTPSGERYYPFRNTQYSGGAADGGNASLARTREGMLEIIEMASIPAGTPSFFAASAGVDTPPDCAKLVAAWNNGGYWTRDPRRDMANSNGGLYGSGAIIDVPNGTLVSYAPTALEHFRYDEDGPALSMTIHASPETQSPTLADAASEPTSTIAIAELPGVEINYRAGNRVDAVSAVLAASALYGEHNTEASIGAATDWVVTFPTKRFYTDTALSGVRRSPFFEASTAPAPAACVTTDLAPFDRDQKRFVCNRETPAQNQCAVQLCGSVSVVAFGASESRVLKSRNETTFDTKTLDSGFAILDLDGTATVPWELRMTLNGESVVGLPAIGFSATSFANGQVLPGVLANYAVTAPHRVKPATCKGGICNPVF